MAVNLTAGAATKLWNGEVSTQKEMMPVLQVTDLKLVQSKLQKPQQKQELVHERFRLLLSDGSYTLQGMLGTSLNDLVKQGNIQVGSILRLTHFVCNLIQNRRIVIINDLEILSEKFNIIGNPVPVKPNDLSQGAVDQHGIVSGNSPNIGGFDQQSRRREWVGGRPLYNSDTGRYGAGNSPQVVQRQAFGNGSGFPETTSSPRPYTNLGAGYGGSRQEQVRAPPTTYPLQAQPVYHPQPPPMYVNRGPVARNEAPPRFIPIAALNPYQSRWTVKVRVTSKGELKQYSNQRGDGKVFNFDLLDADGGEIRVTCFNAVVDQFFDQIVVGNVYLISRGSLRPAQKNFNHLPNDYEIVLDNASTVQQCYEDDANIARNRFHFRVISDIEIMESNSITDVIGIVSSINPTTSIMRKNGTDTQKRTLQLKDMSGRSVDVTMWGNFCNTEGQTLQSLCDSGVFPVLIVKAGRISEFNGKQVSTIGSSQLFIEPNIPEAKELREWFARDGRNAPCVSISRELSGYGRQDARKTITQIKDEKLGTSEKPDWITVSATILYMKVDNFCYTACPIMNGDRPCSKKVTNNGDGTWRCEKCDQCVDECDYRYILQLQLQDHTGLTWVTAFQEAGEEIIGMPAKDLYYVKYEHQDDEKFAEIIRRIGFTKYIFKLKIKEETFSDEQRIKATVVKAEKLNYSTDTQFMLDAMDKLRTEDGGSLRIEPGSSNYRFDAYNSGFGSSGIRDTSSVDTRRDFGLPSSQMGQYENQYVNGSRPLGGISSCSACGNNGHTSANCPSLMSEPQGHYGTYGSTQGRYTGGGPPRQHVGSY